MKKKRFDQILVVFSFTLIMISSFTPILHTPMLSFKNFPIFGSFLPTPSLIIDPPTIRHRRVNSYSHTGHHGSE